MVGCVVLDKDGNIMVGIFIGGMINKCYGCFGDVLVIGVGIYVDNVICGVFCIGYGEYFIWYVVGYDMMVLMAYKGMSLEVVGQYIIYEKFKEVGGVGGFIVIDRNGNIMMLFNIFGMYCGYVCLGECEVGLFGEMVE